MRYLAAVLAVAMFACVAQADVGVTYSDKVMVHGFELFGESDGIAPQVNADVGPFGVGVRGIFDLDSGNEDVENWDAHVSYTAELGVVDLIAQYGYYYYPNGDLDFQTISGTVQVPLGIVSPRGTAVYVDGDVDVKQAWLYVLGLDVNVVENVKLFGDITYNDGFNPLGGETVSDWSHVTVGASVAIPLGEAVSLTPAVYYQHTMEDVLNLEVDEVWYSVSLSYKF